ncbi:MAG: hypothetical protein ACPGU0_02270 [Marinirhabdus sp.]
MQQHVELSKYNGYVFRLCETRDTFGNVRFALCDLNCTINNVQAVDSLQVVEELYAFHNPDTDGVIYFTSKSDADIQEDRGVFNAEEYKKYIFVNDFEYVYFGTLANEIEISFKNETENLDFKLRPNTEDCHFIVQQIHSKTNIKNVISNIPIDLGALFKVPLLYIKTNRKLALRTKDRIEPVKKMELTGTQISFYGVSEKLKISQKRKLKYHPKFERLRKTAF